MDIGCIFWVFKDFVLIMTAGESGNRAHFDSTNFYRILLLKQLLQVCSISRIKADSTDFFIIIGLNEAIKVGISAVARSFEPSCTALEVATDWSRLVLHWQYWSTNYIDLQQVVFRH